MADGHYQHASIEYIFTNEGIVVLIYLNSGSFYINRCSRDQLDWASSFLKYLRPQNMSENQALHHSSYCTLWRDKRNLFYGSSCKYLTFKVGKKLHNCKIVDFLTFLFGDKSSEANQNKIALVLPSIFCSISSAE